MAQAMTPYRIVGFGQRLEIIARQPRHHPQPGIIVHRERDIDGKLPVVVPEVGVRAEIDRGT